MHMVCLDLEGVLIPEIWINFAKKTGIEALRLTTREVPDYDQLMKGRLKILNEYGLTLQDIQQVIGTIDPLEGAFDFLQSLRAKTQVVILSDTFTEFAKPLMEKLSWPSIFCNSLSVDASGMITDYHLRQQDGKQKAVRALQSIGFTVFAAGDSYNDLTMINAAEHGALFCAPERIRKEQSHLPCADSYEDFTRIIDEFLILE